MGLNNSSEFMVAYEIVSVDSIRYNNITFCCSNQTSEVRITRHHMCQTTQSLDISEMNNQTTLTKISGFLLVVCSNWNTMENVAHLVLELVRAGGVLGGLGRHPLPGPQTGCHSRWVPQRQTCLIYQPRWTKTLS
eukprot:scaffold70108_cov49-Prasinocladus_malaysianus.AAC.1